MSSDIRSQAFIIQHAPRFIRPYLLLARVDRPVPILLLLLPALWGLLVGMPGTHVREDHWLIFVLGAFLMRSAGCVINDLTDADFDKRVARTRMRPLASGDLTRGQGLIFLGLLLGAVLGLLLLLPSVCWGVGVLGVILVTLYPWMKRITHMPQIILALAYSWGIPMASFAVFGHLTKIHAALYGLSALWVFIFDTLYAHQDKEDDALLGLGSSALALGERTKPVLMALLIPMGGIGFWVGAMSGRGVLYFAAVLVGCASLAKTIRCVDLSAPESCKQAFQGSQIFGWMLLIGLMLQ